MDLSERAEHLFLAAADLPFDDQAAFLSSACGGDVDLEAEVHALLASDRNSGEMISSAVRDEAARMFDPRELSGQRLGAYRVIREIARGGMGTVYLAARDDDEYQKQVAIKVIKRGMDTAEVLARFRYERQILATLDHPSIARLLDAGTTPDGRPFFVMEYLDGQPIETYVREQSLNVQAICRVFLRVCDAVAHAHRNLIVHRDLKPGNILVMPDGAPKLLDFGVAKLLEASPGEALTIGPRVRVYTPEYASPEQVLGRQITTATDIYALGAIFFELLTGKRAQPLPKRDGNHADFQRAICETGTARPSAVAAHIDADLDNIVLMAMRKEPERRYASVGQLAEDVRRYLEGWPVAARQDSILYRVRKFVRRNKIQVAAAALVFGSLVAATVVSVAQSHRAEIARETAEAERISALREQARAERESKEARAARESESRARTAAAEQRDEAQRQRDRAEQRLNQLIELANRTLFDVHDAIEALPGSVDARRKIVKTTLDYLGPFERENGLDPRMRLVLSAAYYKISRIQWDPVGPSLHDVAGAQSSLRKAQEFLSPVYRSSPGDGALLRRWIDVQSAFAQLLAETGNERKSREAYELLIPLARRLAQLMPDDPQSAMQESALEIRIAGLTNELDGQLNHFVRARTILTGLASRFPQDTAVKNELGSDLASIAGRLISEGDLEGASRSYDESIRIREQLLQADRHNVAVMRNLLVVYGNYAALLGLPWTTNLGRTAEAREYCAKAVAIARELVAADPQNATARFDLAVALSRQGTAEPEPGRVLESATMLEQAAGILEGEFKANPKSPRTAVQLTLTREYLGRRYQALGRIEDAEREFQHSLADAQPFADARNGSLMLQAFTDEQALARLYADTSRPALAADFAVRSVTRAERYQAEDPSSQNRTGHLANAYFELASVQQRLGNYNEAKRAAEHGLAILQPVKIPALLTRYRANIEAARALLASGKGQP